MIHDPVEGLAIAVGLGAVCQVLADRTRVPSIILLLVAGLALGPVSGWFDPDALYGDLLLPAVSAAVGILLFEGGLSLRWRDLGSERLVLVRLLSVGVVAAGVLGSAAAWAPGRLSLGPAVLFGMIMVVTGPTVVIPLLRQARLRPRVGRILRWEGICVDPIGAVLAVVVLEILVERGGGAGDATVAVAVTVVVGIVAGLVAGAALAAGLRRHLIADHLRNPVVFATVLCTLEAANAVAHEAGLIATTVLGIVLANQRRVPVRGIAEFHESIAVLLVPLMFISLAARVGGPDLARNALPALGVLLALVLVVRPAAVWLSTAGSRLAPGERRYLAAMAPRGIVAASVSALFGLRLEEQGIDGGADLAALTFLVVAGTVLIYGTAARPLARRLRVDDPEPAGLVLVGVEPWAAQLAAVLADHDVSVLVIALDPDDATTAAENGLLAYTDRLQSDALDVAVRAVGAHQGLVTSPREEVAAFAADRLAHLIGHASIHVVPVDQQDLDARAERPSEHWGHVAFGGTITCASFVTGADAGHEAFAVGAGELLPAGAIPLVAVAPDGTATLLAHHPPASDSTVIAFGPRPRARHR